MRRLGDFFRHIVGILICSSQITEIYVFCENDNHNCCFYTFSEGWLKLAKAAATFDGKNIQHCGIMLTFAPTSVFVIRPFSLHSAVNTFKYINKYFAVLPVK